MSGSANNDHGSHDKKFFDTFMLVLGSLILVAFGIYFGAKAISASTQEAQSLQDPIVQKAVTERIKPVAQVAVAGADNSAMDEKPAGDAPAAMREVSGEQLYSAVCTGCHGLGIAGAPKFGDKALWAPRIAQGMEILHKHALEGFSSKAGSMMPTKGGATDVTDKSVMDAVDYMVSKSK